MNTLLIISFAIGFLTCPYAVVGWIEALKDGGQRSWEPFDTVSTIIIGIGWAAFWPPIAALWILWKVITLAPFKWVGQSYHNYVKQIFDEAPPRPKYNHPPVEV